MLAQNGQTGEGLFFFVGTNVRQSALWVTKWMFKFEVFIYVTTNSEFNIKFKLISYEPYYH